MQNDNRIDEVKACVHAYFTGMYQRDLSLLADSFHPDAWLFGYINGEFERLSVAQWLDKLAQAPIPAERGENFKMHIIAMDITERIASVKVYNFLHDMAFIDYLSLLKAADGWCIVNKTFAQL